MDTQIEISKSITLEKNLLMQNAKNIQIVDEETLNKANDFLQYAKNMKKIVDDKEKDLTKPLNDTKQKIIDSFKPMKKDIDEIISVLTNEKIIPYQMALKKQMDDFKREEEERLKKLHEEQSSKGNFVQAISIENKLNEIQEIKSDSRIQSNHSSSNISMIWDFEIIEEKSIPNAFLCPDEKKIKEAIKKGTRDIAGIRIFQKPSLRSRNV